MFPRWLTWAFVAVVVYMAFTVGQQQPASTPRVSEPLQTEGQVAYKALAEAADIERWKRAIDPDYAARMQCSVEPAANSMLGFHVIENAVGEGAGAACGQTIGIMLTIWGPKGSKAYEETLELELGSRHIAAGLDAGLIGMKIGGTRTLIIPPHALVRGSAIKPFAVARKALPPDKLAVVTVTRQQ